MKMYAFLFLVLAGSVAFAQNPVCNTTSTCVKSSYCEDSTYVGTNSDGEYLYQANETFVFVDSISCVAHNGTVSKTTKQYSEVQSDGNYIGDASTGCTKLEERANKLYGACK